MGFEGSPVFIGRLQSLNTRGVKLCPVDGPLRLSTITGRNILDSNQGEEQMLKGHRILLTGLTGQVAGAFAGVLSGQRVTVGRAASVAIL